MISFKDLSNLRLEKRYVDADMPVASWFSCQADSNKEPSPLSHRRRSGVDGGLWGSRSHLCNRFMVKCYTNAYKGFSLSLFPAPSFISLSSSSPFARLSLYLVSFLFFSSQPRLPRCFFVVFVRVSRNASALPSIPSLSLLQIHSPQLGLVRYRSRLIVR